MNERKDQCCEQQNHNHHRKGMKLRVVDKDLAVRLGTIKAIKKEDETHSNILFLDGVAMQITKTQHNKINKMLQEFCSKEK